MHLSKLSDHAYSPVKVDKLSLYKGLSPILNHIKTTGLLVIFTSQFLNIILGWESLVLKRRGHWIVLSA